MIASKKHSYDSSCADLAGLFLGDEPGAEKLHEAEFSRLRAELAQHIQNAVEGWLAANPIQREVNFAFSGSF